MSKLLKLVWMVFSLNVGISLAGATEPAIPANLWEQHPDQGVAVALNLTSRTEGGQHKNRLKIYIKNTSTGDEWFYRYDNAASQLRVYYIGANGTEVPLRSYTDSIPDMGVVDSNVGPTVIRPNETVEQSIELSPKEWDIVTSHSVKCSFFISNQKADKGSKIETNPVRLSVTP